jgi:hypothetical protein
VNDQIAQALNTADHDLLIRIAEKIEGLVGTCNNLTVALAKKADMPEILAWKADHEARIRVLEQFNWRLAGALAVLQLGIGLALHYWR